LRESKRSLLERPFCLQPGIEHIPVFDIQAAIIGMLMSSAQILYTHPHFVVLQIAEIDVLIGQQRHVVRLFSGAWPQVKPPERRSFSIRVCFSSGWRDAPGL
jgi:hypothetical protein